MANEFAKMRRLRIGLVAIVMVVCVVGLSLMVATTSPDFADPAKRSWGALLDGMLLAVVMVSPILLAVLASRQVEIEHLGSGWLLSQASGITPGQLCRVKLVALGAVVTVATVLENVLVIGAGLLLGITAPAPIGLWLGYTASVLVVNLILLALHLLLSARIDNQLVGLSIGVLGTLVASFAPGYPAWLAHLTPWGYYALAAATDFRDGALVTITPSYPSIAALGGVGAGLFLLLTSLFDRQEA
ncbi:MAG: ABC transporter permease [Rubrobacteraceae bacterium]